MFDADPKPVVECSFVTEFEDHIYVAMDAEVLVFLHDLVMSYVREKDRGSSYFLTLTSQLRHTESFYYPFPCV